MEAPMLILCSLGVEYNALLYLSINLGIKEICSQHQQTAWVLLCPPVAGNKCSYHLSVALVAAALWWLLNILVIYFIQFYYLYVDLCRFQICFLKTPKLTRFLQIYLLHLKFRIPNYLKSYYRDEQRLKTRQCNLYYCETRRIFSNCPLLFGLL